HALGLGEVHLQLHADGALVDELGRVQEGLEEIEVAAQLPAVMGALAAGELRLVDVASHGDLPGCVGSWLIQARAGPARARAASGAGAAVGPTERPVGPTEGPVGPRGG